MAIGPKQLGIDDDKKLDVLEAQCDKILRGAELDYMNRVTIDVSLLPGLTDRLFNKLRLRYINSGWSEVKWTDDQRDGDFLEFFANPTPEQVNSYYRH